MRHRPPWRRQAEIQTVEFNGVKYTLCVGYYQNGDPAEVFIDGPAKHSGHTLDRESDDTCILISVLLQCGRSARKIGESLSTEPTFEGDESPATLAKLICDHLAVPNLRLKEWSTIDH